jgi:hypothetical protein
MSSAIRNFRGGGSGIALTPNNITTQLFVSDTYISSNGNSSTTGGVVIKPQGTRALHHRWDNPQSAPRRRPQSRHSAFSALGWSIPP